MPPPVPPMVKEGRIIAGSPILSRASLASSILWTDMEFADSRPSSSMQTLNFSRSSALSITSARAPISSMPKRSSVPSSSKARAVLSAVCPPIVGKRASGRSFSNILATIAGVIGSTYVASAMSGSVMIVAGLELIRTMRYPSSRSALQACVPE